jgi:Flp pilus assembly protein TadB
VSVLPAALLAAAAVLLAWPVTVRDRLARLRLAETAGTGGAAAAGEPGSAGDGARPGPAGDSARRGRGRGMTGEGERWWMSPWVSAVVAVFAVTRVVPGASGYLLGAAAAGAVVLVLRATTSAAEVRRQERLRTDLPLAVDLLVACVAAGRPPGRAMAVVASATGGPLGEELQTVATRLELGADPASVWRDLASHDVLGPVGRCLGRSARTGSSVTVALERCSDDVRRDRRATADAAARTVGVRASLPLGVCFLPAFFLVGVLPTIIGSVRGLSG